MFFKSFSPVFGKFPNGSYRKYINEFNIVYEGLVDSLSLLLYKEVICPHLQEQVARKKEIMGAYKKMIETSQFDPQIWPLEETARKRANEMVRDYYYFTQQAHTDGLLGRTLNR